MNILLSNRAWLHGLALSVTVTTGLFAEPIRVKKTAKQTVYQVDHLKLERDEVLVLEEPGVLFADTMELAPGSEIQAPNGRVQVLVKSGLVADQAIIDQSLKTDEFNSSGLNGDDGLPGEKAKDALKGAKGADGSAGLSGKAGSDGAPILVMTPHLRGNLTLVSRGGDGGSGGKGGAGGDGGAGFGGSDARTLYYFRGLDNLPLETLIQIGELIAIPYVGSVLAILQLFNGIKIGDGFDGFDGGAGGSGGAGGDGGDGGKGGNITAYIGTRAEGAKIFVDSRGGKAGRAGLGGLAGRGGVGGDGGKRGDIWARDGNPGKSGEPGKVGLSGKPGKPGRSGLVRLIETGDPEWIKCFIQYREVMDAFEDSELAKEILQSCSAQRKS